MSTFAREIWFRDHMTAIAPWTTERRHARVLQRLLAIRYIKDAWISLDGVIHYTVRRVPFLQRSTA